MSFFQKSLDFSCAVWYNMPRGCKCGRNLPVWWNWQTRRTQNPVVAIPCRFDPDYRHQKQPELNRKGNSGCFFIQVADLAYHQPFRAVYHLAFGEYIITAWPCIRLLRFGRIPYYVKYTLFNFCIIKIFVASMLCA